MSDFEGLTEQIRREIRESMDVFMTDGRDLAAKYYGAAAVNERPEIAATLALALANQFAAILLAAAVRDSAGGKR